MPVRKCPNGKYKIGSGQCMYDSKKKANRAYIGYLGSKHAKKIIGGNNMDVKMSLFVPITKVDEDQRMVYGVATNSALDSQNEIVDWGATKKALEDYSNWRNIREMHKPSAVGVAPLIEARDDKQEVFIGAKIVDDQAWLKCKEGVYKGFSIGGEVLDRKVEINKATGKTSNRITRYNMNEISVVDRPANPTCRFQTVKVDAPTVVNTIAEDPLKMESARVMEKAIMLTKRILSKEELSALPDEAFGLVKVHYDGDSLIKTRDYPMPDKTHAINMVRKAVGCSELSAEDKESIHKVALAVLGKKHNECECPHCIKSKIGGVEVKQEEVKKAATVVPPSKPVEEEVIEDTKKQPAVSVEVKPKVPVVPPAPKAEDADGAAPAPAATGEDKLDRIISLLEALVGDGEEEEEEDMGYEEEAPAEAESAKKPPVVVEEEEEDEDEEAVPEAKSAAEAPIKTEEDDDAIADVKSATEAPIKTEEECMKVKKVKKIGLLQKVLKVNKTLSQENRELKSRLDKVEKQPLPRKGAVGTEKVKVEKYAETPKTQDVRLEKNESPAYSEELKKDISKAQELRASGKALTAEEQAYCQRVAEKMLDAKLSK